MADETERDKVGSSVDDSNTISSERQKKIESLSNDLPFFQRPVTRRAAVSAGATAAVAGIVGLAVGGAVGYLARGSSTSTTTVTAPGTTTTITGSGTGVTTTITETCTVTKVASTTSSPSGTYLGIGGSTSEGFWAPIVASVPDVAPLFNVNFSLSGPTCACCAAYVDAFQAAVAQKPCGIPYVWNAAICKDATAAQSSGIPTVTYLIDDASCINDIHPTGRLAYVGTSQYALSYQVGSTIAPAVCALHPPKNMSVPMFMQVPGRADLESRKQGYEAGIAAHFPCFTYTEVEAGPCNTSQSTSQVTAYLSSHPCTLLAFGTDGISTPGLAGAVENLKLSGKIVTAGFDLLLENLQSIQAGGLYAIANQQPYILLPTTIYELSEYVKSSQLIHPWNSLTGAGVVTANDVTLFYNNRASKYVEATSESPFCVTSTGTTTIT